MSDNFSLARWPASGGIWVAIIGLLGLTGCAAEACLSPEGTYRVQISNVKGSCPEADVKAALEDQDAKYVPATGCSTESKSQSGQSDGCNMTASLTKVYAQSGISGTGSFAVSCSDGSSCQSAFQFSYVK